MEAIVGLRRGLLYQYDLAVLEHSLNQQKVIWTS